MTTSWLSVGGDVHRPAPHLEAVLRLDLAGARDGDRLEEVVARRLGEQVAVADAIDVDRHFRGVDRRQRRAELALARQHIGAAGEMRLRRAVAHVDLVVCVLEQRLADRRGQALAQNDRVAFAVLDALDADLLVLGRDRGVGRAGDRDIGGEVGLARQRLGEIEADARRRRFVVDLVVDDAEAVLLAHVLVDLARVFVVVTVEAGAVGVERRAPHFVAGEEIAERRQRLGLQPARRSRADRRRRRRSGRARPGRSGRSPARRRPAAPSLASASHEAEALGSAATTAPSQAPASL